MVHGVSKSKESTEHCSLLQFVIFKPSVDIYGLKCSKTNNEQSEKKITKTISVIVVSKRKKYLGINQGGKRVIQ